MALCRAYHGSNSTPGHFPRCLLLSDADLVRDVEPRVPSLNLHSADAVVPTDANIPPVPCQQRPSSFAALYGAQLLFGIYTRDDVAGDRPRLLLH